VFAASGDAAPGVSQEAGKSLTDSLSPLERMLPLVVDVARRVQASRHLAIEAAIRPGLVECPVSSKRSDTPNANSEVARALGEL